MGGGRQVASVSMVVSVGTTEKVTLKLRPGGKKSFNNGTDLKYLGCFNSSLLRIPKKKHFLLPTWEIYTRT